MSAESDVIEAAIAFVAEVDVPAGGADYAERSRARAKLVGAVRNLEEARRRREVIGAWEQRRHPYPCFHGSTILGAAEPCICKPGAARPALVEPSPATPGHYRAELLAGRTIGASPGRVNFTVPPDSTILGDALAQFGSTLSFNQARLRGYAAMGLITREEAETRWRALANECGVDVEPLFKEGT